MKRLLFILVLAVIAGCGGQARAAESVFYNVTGNASYTKDVRLYNKVSVQVPPPIYTNSTTAYDISVSTDDGAHYVLMKTYSGVAATASGIYDVTATTAATHVKIDFRQKKKVHNYRKAAATINGKK